MEELSSYSQILFLTEAPTFRKQQNILLSTRWRSAAQKERGPDMAKTQIRGPSYQVSPMATKITRSQPMCFFIMLDTQAKSL